MDMTAAVAIGWLVCGILTAVVANAKNRDGTSVLALFVATTLALLGSCTSSDLPVTTRVSGKPAGAIDPCTKYDVPTDFGRCRLFTSADRWRFIPEIGRNADLDIQIRCAPFRPDLEFYEACIRKALGTSKVDHVAARGSTEPRTSALLDVEPSARPNDRRPWTSQARVEPRSSTTSAHVDSKTPRVVWKSEQTARSSPARVEPIGSSVVRTIPKAPAAVSRPE